jgi:hypothetical protein
MLNSYLIYVANNYARKLQMNRIKGIIWILYKLIIIM